MSTGSEFAGDVGGDNERARGELLIAAIARMKEHHSSCVRCRMDIELQRSTVEKYTRRIELHPSLRCERGFALLTEVEELDKEMAK